MPLASPPSAGAGAGGASSGGLGAAAAGAGGSGAGAGRAAAATTAAAADKGVGCDEEMTWQRRRRVSAVVREELAEVAKALEAGLPQASRPLRRQTSFPAMRGPEDSPQTHLIPTPSGPPSGAATPGMSSPVVGIAGNGNGGSSSNIGYRSAWQQQQPRLLRASLLQDVPAAPPAAVGRKRPADAAAEQLAAKVLAAHKGNWVSALHKLASAVGRQLQNARDAPSLESDGPDSGGAGDHQQQQAPHPGPQPQLTEPEIAAREARLKRVLVHGTRAARAVATQGPGAAGGVHASASAAAAGQQWQQLQLDQQQQQQQQQQQLPATPAFQNTQRQLQLGPHDQPPGGPPGAADSPLGCSPPGPALPQAWNASAPMPHQRPRPGPSRLAHQSSLQAWHTAFQEEAAALEQAEALCSAEAPPAQLARPPSPQDPVLRLQQLHLQQVQLALLGQPAPEFRPDVAAAAAGQLLSAAPAALLQQRLAAYLDEPIISLKEARREARSRSSTPAFGTPRAGQAAAAAASHPFGAAPVAGGAAAMDVDAGHGAGAPGHQMDEEDDEGDDPIAAQLAGAAGAAGCGDLDLAGTERFDFDLVEPEAAAAVGAGGGGGGGGGHVVPVTGELAQLRPHQLARAAHHYHQQQVVLQQHAQLQAAHLQVQGAALVPQAPAEVKCEDGAVAFGAALQLQLQPQPQPRPPSPQ
ncbi:hypothetical protein MNEG_7479 [Monoraphidium neglectum]|uniref:Uncharacterized protein n=1 Tax=Monoraphidium neglectum TaxID=145388 RepID=A0A0D2KZ45_9CHLO|nr:hypothetical protein MNEG_7479 [Monoraphidium neglectum]KIZ00484.1 hypothetical protein MNEG_7479 [Monoraphidium neglectum]|eukprot:XP_013899503.1 hypothetical protein MNEG_7479 [Monoraphidium neglectum]